MARMHSAKSNLLSAGTIVYPGWISCELLWFHYTNDHGMMSWWIQAIPEGDRQFFYWVHMGTVDSIHQTEAVTIQCLGNADILQAQWKTSRYNQSLPPMEHQKIGMSLLWTRVNSYIMPQAICSAQLLECSVFCNICWKQKKKKQQQFEWPSYFLRWRSMWYVYQCILLSAICSCTRTLHLIVFGKLFL